MIEKGKIKNLIYDVFCCDTSDEYNLLYAYCTCKSISEVACFSTDIEKAYLNVKKLCTSCEKQSFLHIAPSRRFDKLEKICEHFRKVSLLDFLTIFVPNLVCDTREFVRLINFKFKISWLQVGYLIFTMNKTHKIISTVSYTTTEDFNKAIVKRYFDDNRKQLKLSNDIVLELYRAICLIKLDNDGIIGLKNALEVVDYCVAHGIPKALLPELVLVANNNNKLKTFAKNNNFSEKVISDCQYKILKLSNNEIAFLCAISYDPKSNDIHLETSYLYPRFSASFSDKDSPAVVVFAPSEFFIRKLLFDATFRDVNYTIVLDSMDKCKIYTKYWKRIRRDEWGSMLFCTFNEFFETENNTRPDSFLLFANHISKEHQKQLKSVLVDMCDEATQVLSLHESSEFETTPRYISKLIKSDMVNIQEIDILPLQLVTSEGKSKKILIKWNVAKDLESISSENSMVALRKMDLINDNYQYLSKHPQVLYTPEKEIKTSVNSIREVYRELIYVNKSGKTRASAKEFRFSPEISVFYTTGSINIDESVRLRCYLKQFDSTKQKFVVIEESKQSFRNVLPISISDVLEEYLYGAKNGKLIRDIIKENYCEFANTKTLSLKTFFYQLFDWVKWREEDAEFFEFAKSIVNSEIGEFDIISTSAKDYERAYYDSSIDRSKIALEKYIEILEEIINSAVSQCVCVTNIWKDFTPDSNYIKDKKYDVAQFAGQSMVTRFLTNAQINKIYQKTVKEIRAGRYEYAAVLIKLFTGMTHREISGLRWPNFCYCEEYDFYVLSPSTDKNRYLSRKTVPRDVPCVKLLSDTLFRIKSELRKSYSNEEISMMPIVPNFKNKKNIYESCTPGDVRKLCKKVLETLRIDGIVIKTDNGDVVLKQFQGDLIRESFRRTLIKYTNLTANERSIILGTKPNKTYSKYYAGYSNEDVLYKQYIKLSSIENLII